MSKLLVVLLLLGVGGYFLMTQRPSDETQMMEKTDTNMMEASTPMIEIKGSKHSPSRLVVKAGEVVSVTNMDLMGHTVTSDEAGLFDSGIVSKGATKTFVAPTTPGEYPYHCTPHPSMTGVLVVE